MQYWDQMRDKYGFDEGSNIPPHAYALREVYVKVLNALLEKRGSKTRVAVFDRPGLHNGCLINVVSAEDSEKIVDALDEIGLSCLAEAMGMGLDDFVTVVVTIDADLGVVLIKIADDQEETEDEPNEEPTEGEKEMGTENETTRKTTTMYKCPKCGNDTKLQVSGTVGVRIDNLGDRQEIFANNVSFDDGSTCTCGNCFHRGVLEDFAYEVPAMSGSLPHTDQPILTAKKLIAQLQAIIAEHGPYDFASHPELEGDYTVVFESPGDDDQTVEAYLHEAVYAPVYHELPHIILKANADVRCE